MTKTKSKIRQPEIKLFTKIGIDKETYNILKPQKKLQEKSMMGIIKDLIFEKYGNNALS